MLAESFVNDQGVFINLKEQAKEDDTSSSASSSDFNEYGYSNHELYSIVEKMNSLFKEPLEMFFFVEDIGHEFFKAIEKSTEPSYLRVFTQKFSSLTLEAFKLENQSDNINLDRRFILSKYYNAIFKIRDTLKNFQVDQSLMKILLENLP